MMRLDECFLDLPKAKRSRVCNAIASLHLDTLDQLRIMTETSFLSVKGCGALVYQEIRKSFPYDESYHSLLSLGERLQANLYDGRCFGAILFEAWHEETFGCLISYMQCLLFRIPELNAEEFQYTSPYRDRSIAYRLDRAGQENDPKAMAYLLVQLLLKDRYELLLYWLVLTIYQPE